MITVEQHQKTLSAKGIHLSVQETSKLLDLQYKLANVFFDLWAKKHKPSVVVKGEVMVVHKQNGSFFAEYFSFVYAYV